MKIIKSNGGFYPPEKIEELKDTYFKFKIEAPIPYHVYVKHPNGKRFLKATIKGYETAGDAFDYMFEIMDYEKSAIGTRYQIRRGRHIILEKVKEKMEDQDEIF